MKKIITITTLIFLLISCNNIEEKKENKNTFLDDYYKGSFSVDGTILDIRQFGNSGGEKLKKLIYSNFDNLVIEIDSPNFLDGIENYKGKELLVHIGYSIWLENSIEILTKLKDLELNSISINIKPDFNNIEQDVDYLDLKKEEAILFSEFKTKTRDLSLTMGRTGFGEFICSDEVVEILGVKKEECGIIQIRENN